MRRIRMPTSFGHVVSRETAWRWRGVAVTRSAGNRVGWTISHIASGRRMTGIAQGLSLRPARDAARLIATSMDWHMFPPDPWNLPEQVQAHVLLFLGTVAEMFDVEE